MSLKVILKPKASYGSAAAVSSPGPVCYSTITCGADISTVAVVITVNVVKVIRQNLKMNCFV